MAKKVTLKDYTGNECYPKTHVKQVLTEDGGNLGDELLNKVDISSLDFDVTIIGKIVNATSPCCFIVTKSDKNIGTLECLSDENSHMMTQKFTTHYLLPFSNNTHQDDKIFTYFRSYHISGGTSDIPEGTWGEWQLISSSDNQKDIDAFKASLQEISTAVSNLNANTGIDEYEEFSESKDFSAGTTVKKDGLLYTFTTDHADGAWDGSQVINYSLKNNLDKLNIGSTFNKDFFTEYQGKYFNVEGKFTNDTNYHSLVTQKLVCKKGDIFKYKGIGRNNAASWVFFKKEDVISYGRYINIDEYTEVTVPEGADSVIFSSFTEIAKDITLDVIYVGSAKDKIIQNSKDIASLNENMNKNNDSISLINKNLNTVLIKQIEARNAFMRQEINTLWENGFYDKGGTINGAINDNFRHAKIPILDGSSVVRIENVFVPSVGLVALLFFNNDEIIGVIQDISTNESFSTDAILPTNTTHIGINSRTANVEKVNVYFDDIKKKDIIITDDNISDNSISTSKLKDYKPGLSTIEDTEVKSSNLANPSEWIKGKFQNGLNPTTDNNYQYIHIDVSTYPIGTKFKCLRPDNYNQLLRFAGFLKSDGSLADDFTQQVKEITKTDNTCVTLCASVYKGEDLETEKYGIFLSDTIEYEEYNIETIAVAKWNNTPNNDNAVARLKDINNNISEKTYNVLYRKKWACCGDSFSAGDFTGVSEPTTIEYGLYKGKPKIYDYLIGNRNNMIIQHMAVGGRTIATPSDLSFTNAFSNVNNQTANSNYTQIDEDADYITLYFGINDSHHAGVGDDGEDTSGKIPMGTIDDTSINTFYGAWNVVVKWIIENRPFAKLGIIVSNGMGVDTYRQAEIEIANKWGIPYIDLNGDERTPLMLRSTNPNISDEAKNARNLSQRVSETNQHPNLKAHEYESTFIENFLRSL